MISAEDYMKCLSKIEQRKRDNIVFFLKDIPFFKHLQKVQLSKIINSFTKQQCCLGQTIIHEGIDLSKRVNSKDSNYNVYIVLQGEFIATKTQKISSAVDDEETKKLKNNKKFMSVLEQKHLCN